MTLALGTLDKNTTAGMVARLEDAGLLRRTRSTDDRRRLTITPEGERVLNDLRPRIQSMERGIERHLSREDHAHLTRILAALVDQHETEPAPPGT
ncbi:MarR family transcriptional regulator [Deinococcus pimensis]|uniref:MarR family transcriptional regulator n=1 Tax=Deinococcus pimensis TaxID=309888 RepID=UPI0004ACE8A0|nr:MarR family transcriptional regulator [Deinococcus pimensis]